MIGVSSSSSASAPISIHQKGYDAGGHRTSVGGSLANVSIPATALGGGYDANNRWTQLNGSTLAYDGNGNLTNNGTNTYSWDARNRLASVTGPVNVNFQYDALGRRVQKTVGSTTTRYLYDGRNFVQEQNAVGTATATLLTGGIDQLFARMTSAGISVPMWDALGSVIGETNSAQTVTTSFAFEPYGTTTQSGTSTGNSQQYAGRENDGTGLYYNHARYYNPNIGRFISEDPIGFRGGTNIYAYVGANPISSIDPLDLAVGCGCNKSYVDCLSDCIQAHDPLNNLGKGLLTAAGGTFPKSLVGLPQGLGGASPLTTVPSAGATATGGGAAGTAGAYRATFRVRTRDNQDEKILAGGFLGLSARI
jgi:RHS repeat-associated protein